MRSRHAERFDHDDQAAGYDADVSDESNPIRAGYAELLDRLAAAARVGPDASVLDLGTGTGNLAQRLAPCRRLVCVDVSREMLAQARAKLAGRDGVECVRADLLEHATTTADRFDAVVSTYAVHHLTADEKLALLRALPRLLAPGGVAAFGDLMFADEARRASYLRELRADGRSALADEIDDEYFWDLSAAARELDALGFDVTTAQVSDLSWMLVARAG